LVEAAVELFSRRGYGGTSLQQVAERVGIEKGSIAYHFETKAKLALEAYWRVARGTAEILRPLAAQDPPTLEGFLAAVDRLVDAAAARPDSARLGLRLMVDQVEPERSIDPKDRSHPVVELLTLLGGWLVRAQRAGAVRRGDPRHLLIHVLGLLLFYPAIAHDVGAAVLEADPFSRAQVRTWKRELRHFLVGALAPAAKAKP
jgi:TetR/AcrR family transcriptional regulator